MRVVKDENGCEAAVLGANLKVGCTYVQQGTERTKGCAVLLVVETPILSSVFVRLQDGKVFTITPTHSYIEVEATVTWSVK